MNFRISLGVVNSQKLTPPPQELQWVFIQTHSNFIDADIYTYYSATSYQDAVSYLEYNYPANDQSVGIIGSVDDQNGTIYEFEVQEV